MWLAFRRAGDPGKSQGKLDLCRAPLAETFNARHGPRRQTCLKHSSVGRLLWLPLAIFGFVVLEVFKWRWFTCFQLPGSTTVLFGSNFTEILQRRTVTAKAFTGVPLATMSSSARGNVLERLVREIDTARNPNLDVSDPELDVAGAGYRSTWTAHYDWLRGSDRIECKSAQLRWADAPRGGSWRFDFRKVKLAFGGVRVLPNFDELYLALYTPSGIYVYRHDLRCGVSSDGLRTNFTGHTISFYGPSGEQNWEYALRALISKLNSSSCEFIEHVPFEDVRLSTARAGYSQTTPDAYHGIPLSELSQSARGKCLEEIVRSIDKIFNSALVFQNAIGGLRLDGGRCGRSSAPYDWLRGGERIECKSAQLCWVKSMQCWRVAFKGIKIFPSKVSDCTQFDDLLLALYTPRGVYVIRHNLKFGISSEGQRGSVNGCSIYCCGPKWENNWSVSLDCILDKFLDNSCDILAFVSWD